MPTRARKRCLPDKVLQRAILRLTHTSDDFLPSLRISNGRISARRAGIRVSSPVPAGLVKWFIRLNYFRLRITVRSEAGMAERPLRGARSRRINSRCVGQVTDLLCAAKQICLRVISSATMFFRPGRAERHGWNASTTIWGWHSAADQQRALPDG